jgi:gamma-glutamylcyclotransferase (GGCT)/AIG2-like uncharacterized protein YtfP
MSTLTMDYQEPEIKQNDSSCEIMPIDYLDDWEQRLDRQDAFWNCEIIDRPVAHIIVPRENSDYPYPKEPHYLSVRERWFDAEYVARKALATIMNQEYLGDALPAYDLNLGPEVFSAYFGMEMEYGEGTTWSIPNLLDWSQVDEIKFSEDNLYWKKTLEITDALLEIGRGKFYTGYTDLHPGGDCLAAFRDPINLNLDMIDAVDEVKSLLKYTDEVFLWVFEEFCRKLSGAGQAISCWPRIVSRLKWFVPSNDFSCMVSKAMFDDVFLPGIAESCRKVEASVYHLDGPGALQHLDSLLEIKELNAIQWVHGAGNGRPGDWLHVYKKCQAAGKGLHIYMDANDLDVIIENLKPEGLWLCIGGVKNKDESSNILKRLGKWC